MPDNDLQNRTLQLTRVANAPIDLVWKVWTTPVHIAAWWGPLGFTNTIHTMDLVAGGEWRLTMKAPDGKTFLNTSFFKEIIPLKKIVFQHLNPNYLATIVFEAKGSETLIDWRMEFETLELFHTVVKVFKADEGFMQNVDKLEKYLNSIER